MIATQSSSTEMEQHLYKKVGVEQFFKISRAECNWNIRLCSSKECSRSLPTSGRNSFEINTRTIAVFGENGQILVR